MSLEKKKKARKDEQKEGNEENAFWFGKKSVPQGQKEHASVLQHAI